MMRCGRGALPTARALLFAATLALPAVAQPDAFEAPVRLEAAGAAIDTAVGHAAPFVGDFDGDGIRDLLVGQFGSGILWIYRNAGTDAAPVLLKGRMFMDGHQDGRVPTG